MLLVRPNSELASARFAKVETTPARKIKYVAGDFSPKIDNFRGYLLQVRPIKDNQRRARADIGGFLGNKKPPAMRPSSNEA
jgi:hypothetical protein